MSFKLNRPIESHRGPALAAAALSLCLLVACVAQKPLDNNQMCPCAPGWSCNTATNVCMRAGGAGGSDGVGGAPGPNSDGIGGTPGPNSDGVGGAPGPSSDGVGGSRDPGLRGIWNGSVALSAPGFAGGPLDRMRIVVGDDGRLSYFDFETFARSQQFGPTTADFPLEGTRDTNGPFGGCPSAACAFHVTVQESTFNAGDFALQYHAVSTGDMPTVDILERIEATLAGDHLQVRYTMVGPWGSLSANVLATGRLALE